MDNIVDILIILFFIISFVVSAFKKKKKSIQETESAKKHTNLVTQGAKPTAIKEKPQAKSPFEEILKSIIQVPEPVVHEKSEVDAYFEEAMRKSEIKEFEQERVNSDFTSKTNEQHVVPSVDPTSYVATMEKVRQTHKSTRARNIKQSLMNKSTIKNYILINEVLGKPIALRD